MKTILAIALALALCGCANVGAQQTFQEGAHGLRFTSHQWIAQEELTVNSIGCCGADFQDVRDRKVQFTKEYIFPAPMATRQITLTFRNACTEPGAPVLWVIYDPMTLDYLTAPIILQGTSNGSLTVPIGFDVHGLGLNVTSLCNGMSEMLLLGESDTRGQ